jgi:SAM-dependent methyltransferase
VNIFAQRLQLQERLTTEIGKALQDCLEPLGVAVMMECRHMCMEMRGVQTTGASTRTQFRCGHFSSPRYWTEFESAVHGDKNSRMPPTATPQTLATTKSTVSCVDPKANDTIGELPSATSMDTSRVATEADNYRLYQSCATNEVEVMTKIIVDFMRGPSLGQKPGLSVLDIGAGNGRLIETIGSKRSIEAYRAFEENGSLSEELKQVVSKLGLNQESCVVLTKTFSEETSIQEAGGQADIVLLSHCLYYSSSKQSFVHHAIKFVAPGGMLFIFHRWNPGETLDSLSSALYDASVLHHMHVFDVLLNLKHLSKEERIRVSKYTNINLSHQCDSTTAMHGCLAIECFSDDTMTNTSISRKVSYEARRKNPHAIVTPGTLTGIQSCLRAAALGTLGSHQVCVVGGGHSANCYADNAIVIDMKRWDHVVVDSLTETVRVGGGATIGAITVECEKYGLVVPLGDRPSVGMGLVLQGGINHLMRWRGLACDNILRVEYVAPSGELQVASSAEELFRFRGAGPSFGVVHEITMKAYKLGEILAQTTDYLLVHHVDLSQVMLRYSEIATNLPDSLCLDGFLYWPSHEALAFATASFDTDGENGPSNIPGIADILPTDFYSSKIQDEPTWCKLSDLFDRELYMTERFHLRNAAVPGEVLPAKLRSLKRCLLFATLDGACGSGLSEIVRSAPTKWAYIHFLHGGGAAGAVEPSESAFGCRNWAFAAVITGRYPDGNQALEMATVCWLNKAVETVMPYAAGVYGADLGPTDYQLAQHAFGDNTRRLALLKRLHDPLNVLSSCCPLLTEERAANILNPSPYKGPRVVIIICGRRFAGKDWLAEAVQKSLARLLGKNGSSKVSIASLSDATKRMYAAENPGVDAARLIHDRQ